MEEGAMSPLPTCQVIEEGVMPMPELDDLMQEWSEEMESKLKSEGFPEPNDMSLSEYIDTLCNLFQIPSAKKKIHSIHLLLCLYAAIKQTQFYRATSVVSSEKSTNASTNPKQEADQLVLE
ncbi:unnamed protein product [Phaedon cochleariae]|uniref:Intraflagellar transport protein 46 homolog n=1 Tax=Phaedon cochleariae TaxID=80249 RepID=A0A9N9X3E2_PHACE|nr:unnamed protein product [Phaedon cochleariae]